MKVLDGREVFIDFSSFGGGNKGGFRSKYVRYRRYARYGRQLAMFLIIYFFKN